MSVKPPAVAPAMVAGPTGATPTTAAAAQAIAASVAQIELAVQEVQPNVERLGALIGAMAAGLGAICATSYMHVSSQNRPPYRPAATWSCSSERNVE